MSNPTRSASRLVAGLLACFSLLLPLRGLAADRAAVLELIHRRALENHAGLLASDALEGREAGSSGNRAAAVYIIDQLEQAGLKPAGIDGSFYQEFAAGYRNILAAIPGADPAQNDQVILLGAHYDHVGYGKPTNSFGPFGQIHNGADDNASGTAVLLAVARALRSLEPACKRTIVLAFWDAEEKGLLGSRHWARQPTVPLDRVTLYVNLDMVGRLRDELTLYGVRTARGLRSLAAQANAETELRLAYNWQVRPDSDHYPLYEKRIPFLMPFTGMHADYHRPSDDVDRLNYDGMAQIGRLIVAATIEAANRPDPFRFRVQSQRESNATRASWIKATDRPSRLGIRWKYTEQRDAVVVTHVIAGKPAERGGMRQGDRILSFGGHAVVGDWDFRSLVQAAANPVTVEIQRDMDADEIESRTLELELDGEPFRIGVSWRPDDAEPDSVLITEVVPGSPAQGAGLQPGDRLLALDGSPPGPGQDLAVRLDATVSEFELTVERAGRRLECLVRPVPRLVVD